MGGGTAAAWERLARAEIARSGGAVRRPGGPAPFDVHWVRSGPPGPRPPVLIVPGGPGLGAVLPYRGLRRDAARAGVDVIMADHRGVGMSRRDVHGADIPSDTVTITAAVDDMAAVLDAAGVDRAVVYGSSYGTYLAQGFGVRHPDRVAGMVLDSPMLAVGDDLGRVRANLRGLLWDGLDPATANAAALLRRMVADGTVTAEEVGVPVQVSYEFGGPAQMRRLVRARARGARRTWDRLAALGAAEVDGPGTPLVLEPDLVRGIAYGELGYGAPPDGHPLDPQRAFARASAPPWHGEPFDLPAALPSFAWPLAVVSGERDLRTPRPTAERIVGLAPDAVLVPLAGTGHSALDTHRRAAVAVAGAVARAEHRAVPGRAAAIAALPRRGASGLLRWMVAAGLVADRILP